jgi:hypothetical protein
MDRPGEHYDVVIIGSSPLCLLEALHHRELGQRVVVVDSAPSLGGAWRDMPLFGFPRVEVGPHVITYNAATYDYFANELGICMQPMQPVPVYLVPTPFGRMRIPYHFSPFIAYLTVPFHFLTNPAYRERFAELKEEYFGRLSDAAGLIRDWLFSGKKPRLLYPRGGTIELMDRICDRMRAAGVEVKLSTRVLSLRRFSDGTVALDLEGSAISTGHVFMTRHQGLGAVFAAGEEHVLGYERRSYTMLHLLVKSNLPRRISYALSKRHQIFNLISDLTAYLPESRSPDLRLITVRLLRWPGEHDRAEVEQFLDSLRDDGTLAEDKELLDFHFSDYEQGALTKESIATIQSALGEAVTIFKSTNFSGSIGDQVERWRRERRAGEKLSASGRRSRGASRRDLPAHTS